VRDAQKGVQPKLSLFIGSMEGETADRRFKINNKIRVV
jgi:hypothetical protein